MSQYPIHKKDNKSDVTNYRSIALINNFGKVFECLPHNLFTRHVSHLMFSGQHGFIKGKASQTNLLSMSQVLCEVLDNHSEVDVDCTNFSKAFDRIDCPFVE